VKTDKKTEYINVRVTPYTKNFLDKLAKEQGRSTSGQVFFMLKQLLPQIVEPVEETDLESTQSPQRIE
tara:strand:+ start:277 stop:480 length:204 start_codon:yes stop_codon:yes gene_type:complete